VGSFGIVQTLPHRSDIGIWPSAGWNLPPFGTVEREMAEDRSVMFPRVHLTVVAAIALAAGLTACSGAAAVPARSDPPRAAARGATGAGAADVASARAAVPPAARQVRCPATSGPTEPIPAGFTPIAVVECIRVTVRTPGGRVTDEEKRQVAVTGLRPLVRALRLVQPRLASGAIPACLIPASPMGWVELVGPRGQLIHPAIPVGSCGVPIPPVVTSLNRLRWITLGVVPAPRIVPPIEPSGGLDGGRPPIEGGPVHRLTAGSPAS
jgi:hypothetical protein